jgi:general secretion pathway protein M
MMTPLPRWLSRTLAIAILTVGFAGPVVAVVMPLTNDYDTTRARIAEAARSLAHYRQIAERLPERRVRLAALLQRSKQQSGFLANRSETLIGAELQSRVKRLVEAANGELRSSQVLPARDQDGYRQVSVRVEMVAELPAAQSVLYQIEASAAPVLFLDEVNLRAHPMDRRDGSDIDPPVDVSFRVYGYLHSAR